jgi:shikimate kinase
LDVPDPEAQIRRLYGARAQAYESAADLTVAADSGRPDEVAERAASLVK